ncbi:MAG TPA: hypothetical protein VF762_16615 [Blastocatellia bacterium]
MDRHSTREMMDRAFQLAYFIHADREIALRITAAAMSKREVATIAQDKRLYYKPGGRSSSDKSRPDRFRTKLSLNDLHILQRLVYVESEVYEMKGEGMRDGAGVSEKDMIIRFIKHLVRITIKRSSFYVALGLSRLLFNYCTSETMEIYNVVVQDPDRVKDDYYYRSRKSRLMQEMKARFGDFIAVLRGQRGEERFQAQACSQSYKELVGKCLRMFTPWDTPCFVPPGFDAAGDVLNQFSFTGSDPDQEHEVEINRIHALLHPDCYGRLTEALRFDSPESRLEVPKFNLGRDDEGGTSQDCREGVELKDEEFAFIKNSLAEQAARRRTTGAGLLRVVVDGDERGRIDLSHTNDVRFDVDESAELIEVCAKDPAGDILLAAHLLTFDGAGGDGQPSEFSITLEGGRRLSFVVWPLADGAEEPARASVRVSYEEMSRAAVAAPFLRRQRTRLLGFLRLGDSPRASALRPAFIVLAFALCVAAVLFLTLMPKQQPQTVAEVTGAKPGSETLAPRPGATQPGANEPPASAGTVHDGAASATPRKLIARRKAREHDYSSTAGAHISAEPEVARNEPETRDTAGADAELTRGLGGLSPVRSLLDVKRIYVESRGDESLSRNVEDRLIIALQATGRFGIAHTPEEGDAALKLIVNRQGSGGNITRDETQRNDKALPIEWASVDVQLVNAVGVIIWPAERNRSYSGPASEVAAKIIRDLLVDRESLERKQ